MRGDRIAVAFTKQEDATWAQPLKAQNGTSTIFSLWTSEWAESVSSHVLTEPQANPWVPTELSASHSGSGFNLVGMEEGDLWQ